jgi:peptidoglycan/LPS O-acetylase OafA/YrhL
VSSVPSGRSDSIAILNVLRGFAALYVAAYHCVDMLTPGGDRLTETHKPFEALLHGNPFGFGRYAVIVFFVLSGFVIHLRQAERPLERTEIGNREWLTSYAWRRGMRIYPPLVFALALTWVLAKVGERVNPNFYGQPLPDHDGWLIAANDNLGPAALFFNLIPAGYTFGSNAPLWSVQYEIWFYVAYAVMLLIVVERWKLPFWPVVGSLAGLGIGVGVIYRLIGYPPAFGPIYLKFPIFVVMYFSVWLLGLTLAELYGRRTQLLPRRALAFGAITLLALLSYWADNGGRNPFPHDLFWGIGIAALIWIAVTRSVRGPAAVAWIRTLGRTADWSYSLYLVHFPVILFVRAVWVRNHELPTNGLLGFGGFFIAVLAGIGAWALVERPTMQIVRSRSMPHPALPRKAVHLGTQSGVDQPVIQGTDK